MESSGIYVLFNTFNVFLWIGNDVDSFFLDQLFNIQSLQELSNIEISEEEVFYAQGQESKGWVQELYAVLLSLRVSQLIYPEFKVLFEMDQQSEILLKELLLEDATKGFDFNVIRKQLITKGGPLAMPY